MDKSTNYKIEERFIGAIFCDEEVIELLERSNLPPEVIHSAFLREILGVCISLRGKALPVSLLSVLHELQKLPNYEHNTELFDLVTATETSFHAKADLLILVEEFKKRVTKRSAAAIVSLVDDGEYDHESAKAQALIREVSGLEIGPRPVSQAEKAMQSVQRRQDLIDGIKTTGSKKIETGIDRIDRWCRPLSTATGDFNCLLFAATSTGKSSLMAQMVSHNAAKGNKVAVFLGETNFAGFIEQMAGQRAKVSIDDYDFSQETREKQNLFMEKLETIQSWCGVNLFVYDDRFCIEDIVTRCKQINDDIGGLDFVVIDHMHCLKTRQKFKDERLKFNYISGELKPLGISLDCPILCLAQPSRGLKTGERPPMLSDLKESGNLEDDADRVWALWMPPKDQDGQPQERKTAKPLIRFFQLKFRRGRVTDVDLRLDKQHTLFTAEDANG